MSRPPEHGRPVRRRVLEPTYVTRRRRTEALAELVREIRENESAPEPVHESVGVHLEPATEDDVTEELPPVPCARTVRRRPVDEGLALRRAAIVVGVTAAALIGFGAALIVPGPGGAGVSMNAAPPPGSPAGSAPAPQRTADPDGPGTLREGDSGPEVTELQQRLRRIPDVYAHGSTDGRFDATLSAAVARFQLWYGIRGDETGVYGNDTRRDLESRTALQRGAAAGTGLRTAAAHPEPYGPAPARRYGRVAHSPGATRPSPCGSRSCVAGFGQVGQEDALSRFRPGVHYRWDVADGLTSGDRVAGRLSTHTMLPT